MRLDSYGTEYCFDAISGATEESCAFLAYRREPEAPLDPREMESWVVEPTASLSPDGRRAVGLDLGFAGFLTGLFRTDAGTLLVTELHGRLWILERDASHRASWRCIEVGAEVELHGVFALDAERTLVWGRDAAAPRMWAFDGARLFPMPAPRGRTTIVRGAGDALYAAGECGLLARWDGAAWRAIPLPTAQNASGLCVVSDDEIWLTTEHGKLFEITSHGRALRTELDGALYDVVQWRGDVWLAGGPRGLLRLLPRTNRIESVAAEIEAIALDARGLLLVLAPDRLATSADGQAFDVICRDVLHLHRRGERPRWRG